MTSVPYPFSAIVGQHDLVLALSLNAVSPAVGGVLVRGEKGTAKSTAVRGLAGLLPPIDVVAGCPYNCDPAAPDPACPAGPHPAGADWRRRPVPLVELPVGASTDRVAGALDLERALVEGRRAFEPGLLAAAHRGILYVDEVNLLGDHLVDLLLDAAALGVNYVEREGVSVRHAARFLLVGTMNPEEGELRPQLLDRFGVTVEVRGNADLAERVEVVRRRLAYEADPAGFAAAWADADAAHGGRIAAARRHLPEVRLPDEMLGRVASACAAFAVDGLRGDIVTAKTAAALAAWEGRDEVGLGDVRQAALLALAHRRRRGPMDAPGLDEEELDRALGQEPEPDPPDPGGNGHPPDGPAAQDGADGQGQPVAHGAGDGHGAHDQAATAGSGADRAAAGGRTGADDGLRAPPDGDRPERAGSGGSGSDGRQAGGSGAGGERVEAAGRPFAPVWFELPGTGAGAWGRRSRAEAEWGRPVADRPLAGRTGDLSPAGTLRAAAPFQRARGRLAGGGLRLRRSDLRQHVREGREGNLVLFVVDASGSMAARRRMAATKGAVLSLLLDAYQRRDRVGLVSFRGEGATVLLPPTASVELAAERLGALPTGGRTPLAAGLGRAGEVLAAERIRDPRRRPLLVLVTDGRANAGGGAPRRGAPDHAGLDPVGAALAQAAALAARGVAAVVVDTEDGAVRLGIAAEVARALAAPCVRLDALAAQPLAGVVRWVTGGGPRGPGGPGGPGGSRARPQPLKPAPTQSRAVAPRSTGRRGRSVA
ncbi:MAG TPA: VWA domain-containing protein [Actinomycetes bacterium]